MLLWKKLLCLTVFKIVKVIRPSTLLRVYFKRGSRFVTKRDWEGLSSVMPQILKLPLLFDFTFTKILSPSPFMSYPIHTLIADHLLQKVSVMAFSQILPNILPWCTFSVPKLQLIWKSSLKLYLVMQISVQQNYLP